VLDPFDAPPLHDPCDCPPGALATSYVRVAPRQPEAPPGAVCVRLLAKPAGGCCVRVPVVELAAHLEGEVLVVDVEPGELRRLQVRVAGVRVSG